MIPKRALPPAGRRWLYGCCQGAPWPGAEQAPACVGGKITHVGAFEPGHQHGVAHGNRTSGSPTHDDLAPACIGGELPLIRAIEPRHHAEDVGRGGCSRGHESECSSVRPVRPADNGRWSRRRDSRASRNHCEITHIGAVKPGYQHWVSDWSGSGSPTYDDQVSACVSAEITHIGAVEPGYQTGVAEGTAPVAAVPSTVVMPPISSTTSCPKASSHPRCPPPPSPPPTPLPPLSSLPSRRLPASRCRPRPR